MFSILVTILLLLIPTVVSEEYAFGPFNQSYLKIFDVIPIAKINSGSLYLSSDTTGISPLANKGGVFFKKPFKLWEEDGKVASFNTSFFFKLHRVRNVTPGEGFAFLVSPSRSIEAYSFGQYLGLTNNNTDGKVSNKIVAIEFDTMKQDFDLDDNHIGLDLNSVDSVVSVPLSHSGIHMGHSNATYVAWVEYDGAKKLIQVYMIAQHDEDSFIVEKPNKPLFSYRLDMKGFVNQMSYFGFSASTGNHTYQLNIIQSWNLSVQVLYDFATTKDNDKLLLKIGWVIGAVVILLSLILAASVCYLCNKNTSNSAYKPPLSRTLRELQGTLKQYMFRELKMATQNFNDNSILGRGGFGIVYRGLLTPGNLEVAIKKFSTYTMEGTNDFWAELRSLNLLSHKNLLPLLGWCDKKPRCYKRGELFLVYDYMPNSSLDKHIFSTNNTTLTWDQRHQIISGVAAALHYLQNEFDKVVLHRDLKASNIMLDANFNPRLGDFGLARILDIGTSSYEMSEVAGTRGYMAPECFYTNKATCESDVYGFGAVLLEVVSGRRALIGTDLLVDWVWGLHSQDSIRVAVDQKLDGNYVVEDAERMLKLALACSNPYASERPNIQTIVQVINGVVPVPHVPLSKPNFVFQGGGDEHASSDAGDPSLTTSEEHTSSEAGDISSIFTDEHTSSNAGDLSSVTADEHTSPNTVYYEASESFSDVID